MILSKFIVIVCSKGIPISISFSASMSEAKSSVDQYLSEYEDFICDTPEQFSIQIFRLVEV